MTTPVLLFTLGLILLIKGGDWFVDGATGIAKRFRVPELLIGATVVSIGTTLPEVMVSATSALAGHGEIAYGNAIGSVPVWALRYSSFLSRRRSISTALTPWAPSPGWRGSSCWGSLWSIWASPSSGR